jgi:hypothetical protein
MRSPLKARPLRNPGQYLDEEIDRITNDQLIVYFLALAFLLALTVVEWVAVWFRVPRRPWVYTAMAAIALVVWYLYFRRVRCRLRALKLGRDGERAVGQFLDGLRESGARIFHDIPGERFNVDHVVICQKGILAIEAKTWSKRGDNAKISVRDGVLRKDGSAVDRNPIGQVEAIAAWLKKVLQESTGKSLPVRPVLLFPGWFVESLDAAMKERLWMLEPKALPAWIDHEPVRLSDGDVALAAFHLSRYVRAVRTG